LLPVTEINRVPGTDEETEMSVARFRRLEWWEEETPMAFPAPKRLLSDDDLQRMETTGIVPPGRRFELIQGEVYERDQSGLCKHLFDVDEYQQMATVGILSDDERVELIRGEIYKMSPVGDPHIECLMDLSDALDPLKSSVRFSIQSAIRLRSSKSMPQPDLVLVRREGRSTKGAPNPEDIPLLIEVCDSSLNRDQKKLPLYAASGIPEVWLVDLNSRTVFVYRNPAPEGYPDPQEYRPGQTISPLAFQDFSVSVNAIFG
jgi:Uma2 family endonuclease